MFFIDIDINDIEYLITKKMSIILCTIAKNMFLKHIHKHILYADCSIKWLYNGSDKASPR